MRAYGDDRADGSNYAPHEGIDLADGAVPAEGGDQVVVDPDLSDEEEGRRRDLPLLCRDSRVRKKIIKYKIFKKKKIIKYINVRQLIC